MARTTFTAATQADDGDVGVGQAGPVAGQFVIAHAGAISVPRPIAGVMEPVFDLPVSPGKGEDLCGTDAFWAERGEAVNGFNGGGVPLRNGSAAADTGRTSTVDKGKSNAVPTLPRPCA